MTKKIEKAGVIFAAALAILLVAQYGVRDSQIQHRQEKELDVTEELHRGQVYAHLEQAVIAAEQEEARMAEELKKRQFDYAQKCFKKWDCYKLAEAAYFEDRGGGIEGMEAVVNVVMNRVNLGGFPNSIVGVVDQKRYTKKGWVCQFSYMCQLKDRRMKDKDSRILAGYVAWKAYDGNLKDITNGATHYYNPDKVRQTPRFAEVYPQVAEISDHLFYRRVSL